ncbi:MAG: DUF4115 domain-containing protein [Thermomicrobiales bacterium]
MSDLGDLLRRARAHKGVTLRDAEKRTRISRHYLAALEAHDFDQLPPRAYARGIVRNYAQYLGLDPAAVLSMFEAADSESSQDTEDVEVVPAVQPIEIHGHWAPNFAIIIFMLVISAVIFTWIYSAYLQPDDESVPTTIAQPTATAVEQSLLDAIALTPTPSEVANADESSGTAEATPTAEASESESSEPTSTEASESSSGDAPAVSTPTEEDVSGGDTTPGVPGPDILPSDIQIPPGYHVFAVVAEEEVWVQVSLDEEGVAYDGILQSGESEIFLATSATVTSGNAAYVRVYVDGEDYGTLGEPWDAIVTYP